MPVRKQNPGTCAKALKINLDPGKYGVFAEIGAGQETANWFFHASGTAGTVAKTISAYDMTMSDALYGKMERYVSEERLTSMLRYEYQLLEQRLGAKRADHTTFFSFCNTVRARGYQDKGECHGWLGIRLQLNPLSEPCEIILHLRLLDDSNEEQMAALVKSASTSMLPFICAMIWQPLFHHWPTSSPPAVSKLICCASQEQVLNILIIASVRSNSFTTN